MYEYENEREKLFTDQGQRLFLKIRGNALALIDKAGAARMSEIISVAVGNSWEMLACVDRMVELGELKELTDKNKVVGQYRVFVRAY